MTTRAMAATMLLVLAGCSGKPFGQDGTAGDSSPGPVPLAVRSDQHIVAGGITPPGAETRNPYGGQATSAAEGGKLFGSMNCDGCHGIGATGFVGPSLGDGRWRYGGSEAAIYQSIYYGRPRGMPAYGGLLQPAIIWKLVTYLQSLPVPKSVPTQSW